MAAEVTLARGLGHRAKVDAELDAVAIVLVDHVKLQGFAAPFEGPRELNILLVVEGQVLSTGR